MSLDLGTLVATIKLDDGQFQRSVTGTKAKIDGLKRDLASMGVTKARIDADSAKASARIKALKAEMAGLDKEVKLGVVTEQTDARIKQIRAELASISDAKVKIDVDAAAASARIKELKAQLAGLDDRKVKVKVDVDQSSVQGISTLTAALLALGPALAPLAVVSVGGVAAMGPALLAGGAAAGVAVLAFHGVGEALTAMSAHHEAAGREALASAAQERTAATSVASAQAALVGARRSAAQGAASAAAAVRDAQTGVTRAEQAGARATQQAASAVADARRGVARASEQAAEGIQSALRQQGDAERRLADAQRDARQAQQDLSDARESARRKLADYTLDVAQAALNERQAQFDLADSKKKLNAVNGDPSATVDARNRAQLAYEQQLLQVRELTVHNKQLRADAADAAQKGVRGSDEVTSARAREVDAVRQVHDAQVGLRDAVTAVSKAHRDGAREIADAERQVAKAVQAQSQTAVDNAQRVADAERSLASARAASVAQAIGGAASVAGAQQGLNTALANQHALNGQVSASQQKLNDSMAALSPAGRDFVRFLSGLGPALKPLQAAAQGGLFAGITTGITAALPALPALRDAIAGVSGAMGDLAADLGRSIGGPGGQAFLNFVGATAPPLIRQFGRLLGSLGGGFAGMSRAFMPVTTMITRGLTSLAARFDRFANGGGFDSFVAFMVQNGPVIAGILGRIVKAVGRLVEAALPIGMAVLQGLGKVADVINAMPVGVLTGIAGGIAAVVVVLKAWGFATKTLAFVTKLWTGAQWLLNAAMDANPIGLVVLAIAALVAGFIIAYKHSETFRRIVDGAMRGVKAAAAAVVGWFRDKLIPFFTEKVPAAFQAVKDWIGSRWGALKRMLTGPVAAARTAIGIVIDRVRGIFTSVKDWLMGAWKQEWAGLKLIFTNPVQAAKNIFQNLLGAGGPIRSAFSSAVTAIKNIWAKLKGAALAPVRFIVNTVYNDGIRRVVNAIPMVPNLPAIKGFRTGGSTGPGRDDEAVGVVHGNEHVVTADEVRRTPGGHGTWERIRAAALAGQMPGYKAGGAVWPTVGRRISTYANHDGVDINQPPGPDFGAPIYAWRSGKITYAGWGRGYGHAVFEKAPGYPEVVYGHSSAVHVRTGQNVTAGQTIADVGATGNASGPHLHFGHPGGTYAQALALLRGAGSAPGSPFAGVSTSGSSSAAYSGPSLASIAKALNPAKWKGALTRMGGWGPMLGGMVGSIAGAVKGYAFGKVKSAIKATASYAGAGPTSGGQGTAQWAPTVRQALIALGQSTDLTGTVLRRMSQESGGNPRAVNHTDSNARAGYPSTGLMQVIRGTYKAYKPHPDSGPYMNGVSINPYSNIYAGLNYAQHRYGSVAAAMNKAGGYDRGGIARGTGYMEKRIIKPERVLSPRQTDVFEAAMARVGTSHGAGGARVVQNFNGPITTVDVDELARKNARKMRDALALMGS